MKQWPVLNTLEGLPANEWLYALIAVVASYALMVSVLRFVIGRLQKLASRTAAGIDDIAVAMLQGTHRFAIMLAALLIGAQFLSLPDKWENRMDHLWFLVIGFQIALWVNRGVMIWTSQRLQGQHTSAHNPVITTMISWALRALLWAILLLAVLSNVGVNITAFVASLGVGGVAVALAVQSILSDLFASAAIGLDKPFETGDFIVFGDVAGSIEHIGLKTTRIRSLSGEQIVCSNTELLKNTIHNYKRMSERRILFAFGVTYDTSPDQLRKVPGIVRKAISAAGNTRFDRTHMKGFGVNALEFEVVYYVTDASYNVYMDIQQSINFELIAELAANDIKFALPTRSIRFAATPEESDKPGRNDFRDPRWRTSSSH